MHLQAHSNHLELIAIVGDTLPFSLAQLLEQDHFNWQVQVADSTIFRVERIGTPQAMQRIADFCQQHQLRLVVILGSDDKSYVELLRYAPVHSRVLVYLDNKHVAASLILNPSRELYQNWQEVALGIKPADTSNSFIYPVSSALNQALANGFSKWLSQTTEAATLSQQLVSLAPADFKQQNGLAIHQRCQLITKRGNLWTGSPNPFVGFRLQDASDAWAEVGQFYLQAAASQHLQYWFEHGITLPHFVISIDEVTEETGEVYVRFSPRDDSQQARDEMLKITDAHSGKQLHCRILHNNDVVLDIPILTIAADGSQCGGFGVINKNLQPDSVTDYHFAVQWRTLEK